MVNRRPQQIFTAFICIIFVLAAEVVLLATRHYLHDPVPGMKTDLVAGQRGEEEGGGEVAAEGRSLRWIRCARTKQLFGGGVSYYCDPRCIPYYRDFCDRAAAVQAEQENFSLLKV